MIYLKVTDDIETAKKALPIFEGICFIHHRNAGEVYIVSQKRYQSIIENKLSVESIEPYTEKIREELINLDYIVFAGDVNLIQ